MNNANKIETRLHNEENFVKFSAPLDGWVTMTNSVGERAVMLRTEAEGRIAILKRAGWTDW